jgi:hypothetical protein
MTQEALKRALDFVESINLGSRSASVEQQREVIAICKEALAHPLQRPWVGLTDEETSGFTPHEMAVVKYVSKVLQEKNT